FVATKTDFGFDNLAKIKFLLSRLKPDYCLAETVHNPVCLIKTENKKPTNICELENKKVCLLASIADPVTFENTILKLGLTPILRFYYLDHYQYKKADLERTIQSCAENKINTIITTEKDLPRINEINPNFPKEISLYILRIGIKFTNNEKLFFERLLAICKR
ncbi:MAG: hypothetical protein FJZ11_06175, partial [Candidatus Omnitrophica bacterium]|nr:hypothetical protein [Candidatus Omnitrophota bacterium]